jgi:predicted transcriptional regulator
VSRLVETKIYIEGAQHRALDLLAARTGRAKSEIVRAALASFLTPDGPEQLEAALSRRLDRLARAQDRQERDLGIGLEALALFIRAWLTATPPVPEPGRAAAEAKGRERYLGFVEALGRRLAAGRSLRDEVLEDRADPARDAQPPPGA